MYGIKLLLTSESLATLTEGNYATVGRMVRNAFVSKLGEDGCLDAVKSDGVAVEIYLKDLTEKEKKEAL